LGYRSGDAPGHIVTTIETARKVGVLGWRRGFVIAESLRLLIARDFPAAAPQDHARSVPRSIEPHLPWARRSGCWAH
jgi:hypothetical protein